MSQLSDALLSAHIQHELSHMRGEALTKLLDNFVASVFQWFADVKLDDAVTRAQILGVIERYAVDFNISGGITELAGEMSNAIFSSRATAQTRLDEVCDAESYAEFAEKIVGLEGARHALIRYVTQSPGFSAIASRVVSRAITDVLFRREGGRPPRIFGLLGETFLPAVERRLGGLIAGFLEEHAERVAEESEKLLVEVLDSDGVREIADELWDSLAERSLSDATSIFSGQDLEDFVVLIYEFWLKFRKTAFFRAVCAEVVERLFAKYGDETVASVIDDMGVSEAMVRLEIHTFAGPLCEQALRSGFAEQQLRAHLEPFYRSAAVSALLDR